MAKRKTPRGRSGFSNLKPGRTRNARAKLAKGISGLSGRLLNAFLIEFSLKSFTTVKQDLNTFFEKQTWWEEEGQRLAETFVSSLDRGMKTDFFVSLSKVVGIEVQPVIKELGLEQELSSVVSETLESIKSIKGSLQVRLDKVITNTLVTERDITKGRLGEQIEKVLRVSPRQARNLARSATAKVNGKMIQVRMARSGIEEYDWSNSKDIAVRPSHVVAGKVGENTYRVGEDVVVNVSGEGLVNVKHPGYDWGCRCVAIPKLRGL